jgi:hypothetical protein
LERISQIKNEKTEDSTDKSSFVSLGRGTTDMPSSCERQFRPVTEKGGFFTAF